MPRRWLFGRSYFAVTLAGALLLAPSCLPGRGTFAAEPSLPARAPWTTSRVVGSPDPPPPLKVVRAFPNLKFEKPLLMVRMPGSDRLIVGEQAGVLHSFANRPDATADLFCDLRKEVQTVQMLPDAKGVNTVYGLAFHPDFERNRQCYVCYTLSGGKPGEPNLKDGTRVSRFLVTRTDPPRIDPASEQIVLTFLAGGHNGGDLHFGNDGFLYISTGDAAGPNPPDPLNTGQDISDLHASILRIDVDHRDEGLNYAVPRDNPFVGLPGARPEVWAYGFRNPWRMSFDRETGDLFVGDVGWELWESIHRVERGGNYGWSAAEGPQPIKANQIGPTPIHPALIELPHSIACSITGGYVYRGQKFPELRGAYVFGDWETRRLWAARFEGNRTVEMPEITRPTVRFSAFGEDHAGELYFLDHDTGTLHSLARNDAGSRNTDFPQKLTQTGLFASVPDHQPAAGVIPFAINSRQWLDGAQAEHWAAFPGESFATLHETGKPVSGLVYWHNFRMHFPKDAVLLRTLSLEGRRLETQLLHFDGEDWRAYTYVWRDDQSDADLAPAEGGEHEVLIGKRKRVWPILGRGQCMSCHSNQTEYALAFAAEQLNRPGKDGRNQLIAFTEAGLIRRAGGDGKLLPPFDPATAERERKVADPHDESQPLEARARGYLHANCGHCHSDHGGGAVPLRLQFHLPLDQLQAVGVRPTRGDFTLPEARIIKPGDPHASTLYYRMAKFGRDRMPHIGSELPDEAGLALIERWIAGMNGSSETAGTDLAAATADEALRDVQSAIPFARRLGRGELDAAQKESLLAAATKLEAGLVRDLFEGYLPVQDSALRKLGSSPRPQTVLAYRGDASRGEKLFWSEAVNCGKCHRVEGRGVPVGPDLSSIGNSRTREDLLESLLSPSRRIEPKFAAYVAQSDEGTSATGVLVKRDAEEVVLRDAQGKEVVLRAAALQRLQPARTSLMPDGQMAGLTAQEAADLLEFLASQKSAPVSSSRGD
jgi:putative heme-binding domain-containing protein